MVLRLSSLLLLLLLLPMMCSDLARLCSASGSAEMRRSRLFCIAARRNNWCTVLEPWGGDVGDVNRLSSTNLSGNTPASGWWW